MKIGGTIAGMLQAVLAFETAVARLRAVTALDHDAAVDLLARSVTAGCSFDQVIKVAGEQGIEAAEQLATEGPAFIDGHTHGRLGRHQHDTSGRARRLT